MNACLYNSVSLTDLDLPDLGRTEHAWGGWARPGRCHYSPSPGRPRRWMHRSGTSFDRSDALQINHSDYIYQWVGYACMRRLNEARSMPLETAWICARHMIWKLQIVIPQVCLTIEHKCICVLTVHNTHLVQSRQWLHLKCLPCGLLCAQASNQHIRHILPVTEYAYVKRPKIYYRQNDSATTDAYKY